MPNRNYVYGREAEWNVRKALEGVGYSVLRAAASQGVFDVVGFHKEGRDVVAVQVKRGEKPSPCEYKSAIELPAAPSVIKMVVWYPPRLSLPRVLYCNGDLPEWCFSLGWQKGDFPKQFRLRGLC